MKLRPLLLVAVAAFAHFARADEVDMLAMMTFDFGSACGMYSTGNSKARIVKGGSHPGSRGMLEICNRTEKWNSGEFNLTGRVYDGRRYRFAANVRQDSTASRTSRFSSTATTSTSPRSAAS